jgi:selenide,water dikinase
LLIGSNTADDAGIYRLNDTEALVVTTDFFPPIVDDPYMFGQIAAANALSDVYAMGGKPIVALNILCFPYKKMSDDVMHKILLGGHDKVIEAGAVIAGGHSVKDAELKYGLAVTGIVRIDRIMSNATARVGDKIILTKPLGTGIISTAMKNGIASSDTIDKVVTQMAQLNRNAAEAMSKYRVSAVTDVTGYGLIGHALEMAEASGVSIRIESKNVPIIPQALELAEKGQLTGGGKDNIAFCSDRVSCESTLPDSMTHLLHDAQTSGGLLIAVHPDDADRMLSELRKTCPHCSIIGTVESNQNRIIVK